MIWSARAVTFTNARVVTPGDEQVDSITVRGGRIDRLGGSPHATDVVVDLDQAVVFPGLINAHDHLELNSFGRLKWRPQHANVREWIADFQPRFAADPDLALARARHARRSTVGRRTQELVQRRDDGLPPQPAAPAALRAVSGSRREAVPLQPLAADRRCHGGRRLPRDARRSGRGSFTPPKASTPRPRTKSTRSTSSRVSGRIRSSSTAWRLMHGSARASSSAARRSSGVRRRTRFSSTAPRTCGRLRHRRPSRASGPIRG